MPQRAFWLFVMPLLLACASLGEGLAMAAQAAPPTVVVAADAEHGSRGSMAVDAARLAAHQVPAGSWGQRQMAALLAQTEAQLAALVAGAGGHMAISWQELDGAVHWNVNGDDQFTAASTYKLGVLAAEAQRIASGAASSLNQLCFQSDDYENGYFGDYGPGACFALQDLAYRAGHYSDNTAAHMLVRDLGGPDVLNATVASWGAVNSQLFLPNVTTANDLSAIWTAVYQGKAGGSVGQQWLYPILEHLNNESGITLGTGTGITVAHKGGDIYSLSHDTALVFAAHPYVLTVMSDGVDGGYDQSVALIQQVGALVWAYESRCDS